MTAPSTVPPAALTRAEEIVSEFANGGIKTTWLFYEFFGVGSDCPQLPPAIDDRFTDAYNAYREWDRARVGDTHWQSVKERRAQLDKALVALVAALDAATTRKAVA